MGRERIVGVAQVRFASTRLPRKAVLEICGKPLLLLLVERFRFARECEEVVISTADTPVCRPIVELAEKHGIGWYAGSEEDLVSRYLGTAEKFSADAVIRVTGDCPLVEPAVIDRIAAKYREGGYDFVGNTLEHTYPHGLEAEAFSVDYLKRYDQAIKDAFWREWFSSYTKEHPDEFRIASVTRTPNLSSERWTVDYPQDFELVKRIYEALYREGSCFSMDETIQFLDAHPELREINNRHTIDEGYRIAKKEKGKE